MPKVKTKLRRPKRVVKATPTSSNTYFATKGDRCLVDMRMFFHSVDWAAWWGEWYLTVDKKNQPAYKTLREFVEAKAESKEQKKFLFWYLGARIEGDKDGDAYHTYAPEPVDWMQKRQTGGWFTEGGMKALKATITARLNALDALRETGNKYGLHFLVRADQLAQRIDAFFKGTPLIPGLSDAENFARASQYLRLQQQVLQYYRLAQELYAKSHGVNFEQMDGLIKLMEATALSTAQQAQLEGSDAKTPIQSAVLAFAEVALAKAGKYPQISKLMPPDTIEAVAERVNEAETVKRVKKDVPN